MTTFLEQQRYMQGVILGTNKPPFVIIYEHTLPYLYPLLNFPYSFGFITFPLAGIGLSMIGAASGVILISKKKVHVFQNTFIKREVIALLFVCTLFPIIYFGWTGQWYAKFARYYIVLLPFMCIYASLVIIRLPKIVRGFLGICILLNGLMFFQLYVSTHTRVEATRWIYQNTPDTAKIAYEHWDDPLPLPMPEHISRHMNLNEMTVYNEPDSPEKIRGLAQVLSESDYVVFSSRRVYASILNNPDKYPYTSIFYTKLFAGELGFRIEKEFERRPYIISDDHADESFQSYDHPHVVIFKKESALNPEEITSRIL